MENVTLGVPRLAELINVSRTNKTPSLTIYLQEDIASDLDRSKVSLNKIELCKLVDIIGKTEIQYDPEQQVRRICTHTNRN